MNDDSTVKVCVCGHLQFDHIGAYWFHQTHCNVECGCEKFTTLKECIVGDHDDPIYIEAINNMTFW